MQKCRKEEYKKMRKDNKQQTVKSRHSARQGEKQVPLQVQVQVQVKVQVQVQVKVKSKR